MVSLKDDPKDLLPVDEQPDGSASEEGAASDEEEQEQEEELGPERQFAVVELSGQSLAIDILRARTILDRPPITRVPFTSEFILGVANVRGDIYSIIDIRPLIGLAPADSKKKDPLVLLITGSKYVCGITIESITEIVRVREREIAEPTTEMPYVDGVYRQGQESVMVLDVEGLLSSPEMTQFQ